jgi:SAM-dependent methyltransferase
VRKSVPERRAAGRAGQSWVMDTDGVTVAEAYGRRWSAEAAVRAEHLAHLSRPAWEAVLTVLEVGTGTALLDVACGSGELVALAHARGAVAHGIDAADAMVMLARVTVPGADLRIGTLERLPWADAVFDVVTGFNAFQFAPDIVAAFAEAARVTRPGGRIAVCNWGGAGPQDLITVTHGLQALAPDAALVPRRPVGEPGVLEELLRAAGLRPSAAGDVAVPYTPPDRHTLERGMFAAGNLRHVVRHLGAERAAAALAEAAAPFRREDGSYLFHSTFRWVVAERD